MSEEPTRGASEEPEAGSADAPRREGADREEEEGALAEEPAEDPEEGEADEEEDEDPPGPDVPAPPLEELRAALDWAFDGEPIAPELLDRFARYAELLLEANRRVNLTAVLDPREIAAKHFLDSWRVAQFLPLLGRRVVDLGSGGGFPGLPIAMTEEHASVVLTESRRKKAEALAGIVDALGVRNCTVHPGRAEEFLVKERCDVVVVRAVSSVRENVRVLRKVRHSLKDLVMLKGPTWSREVRAGEREAERLGFHLDTVYEHELPGDLGGRAILIYRAPGGAGM